MLEKREKEWIAKLQHAQQVQQNALKHLEVALVHDPISSPSQPAENRHRNSGIESIDNSLGSQGSSSQPRVSSAPHSDGKLLNLNQSKPPANTKSQKGLSRPPSKSSRAGSK